MENARETRDEREKAEEGERGRERRASTETPLQCAHNNSKQNRESAQERGRDPGRKRVPQKS